MPCLKADGGGAQLPWGLAPMRPGCLPVPTRGVCREVGCALDLADGLRQLGVEVEPDAYRRRSMHGMPR